MSAQAPALPNCEKICAIPDPLNWDDEKNRIFYAACWEIARFHVEKSPDIRHLYGRYGFEPSSIRSENDIQRIPMIGVTAMKHFLMTSRPHDLAVLKLTSSGTRGQKTQIWFDQPSLDRVQRMLDVYLEQEGFVSNERNNYLVFNYDPDDAGDLGVAYTEKNQLRFAPVQSSYYAIKKDQAGKWVFHKDEALTRLKKYEKEGIPVRIFGMPAFLFEFLEYLRESGVAPFRLPPRSWILTGGGWKAAEDKRITRDKFRVLCAEAFGIPPEFQRDAYGMAEHCAPYFECKEHRFHIAVFNRILIREPITLRVLPDGEVGLMELITPFNAMMPTLAILSTDYGRIRPDACPCGWRSPTFELLGRAGISKHKGCAMTASEIVRRA